MLFITNMTDIYKTASITKNNDRKGNLSQTVQQEMRALGKLDSKTSAPKNDLLSTETKISNLNTSIRMTITAWCSTSAFVSATSAQQSEESLTACWECCRIFPF